MNHYVLMRNPQRLHQVVPHILRKTQLGLGNVQSQTVGTMAHEYGHILGLPDLFDVSYLSLGDAAGPEEDSAGIGNWGLMGWGASGWNGDDGPTALSAWSRVRLGWSRIDTMHVSTP